MERINKQRVFNFYNRKNKWLGLIDYKTLLFCLIYIFIIFKLVSVFNISYIAKTYIAANLLLPLIIFVLFNLKEESIIDKLIIIILFYVKRKIYTNNRYFANNKCIYVKSVEKYHIEKTNQK